MPVRVTETCRVAYASQVIELTEGQEIQDGELATYLLATGAPVESIQDDDAPTPPPVNAPKQAWVDHAVALGADPDEAAAATKAALIAEHGSA